MEQKQYKVIFKSYGLEGDKYTDDYFKSNTNNTLYAKWDVNSINLPAPTRTGYDFVGWFDSETNGNEIGTAGEAYIPTNDVMLYARWNISKYKLDLNFNVDGTAYNSGYEDRILVKLKINGEDKGYVKDYNVEHEYGTKWEITGLKLDNIEIPYSDSGTLSNSNLNLTKKFFTKCGSKYKRLNLPWSSTLLLDNNLI